MSIINRVKGELFTSSGLPKLTRQVAGFPAGDDLQGIYLFEDGAVVTASIAGTVMTVTAVAAGKLEVGQVLSGANVTAGTTIISLGSGTGGAGTYNVSASQTAASDTVNCTTPAVVRDSSGLANHATIATGSTFKRIAEGIEVGAALNQGFLAKTPLDVTNEFTFLIVDRLRVPGGTSGAFPVAYVASNSCSGGAVAVSENVGRHQENTRGRFVLNYEGNAGALTVNSQVYNTTKTSPYPNWAGNSIANCRILNPVASRDVWFARAFSFNAITGAVTHRMNGQTATIADATSAAEWLASAGKHCFGHCHYDVSSNTALGDVGLAAFYNTAKSVADIDVLIAAAKARMALRGVTVL